MRPNRTKKNRPADGRQPQTAQNGGQPEAHRLPITPPANIVLGQGDKVFFAGDSMMQGVAPFVERSLKKQYGIQSVNLSKQSTGLSYPKFFDWPNTIEQTLKQQTDIRLLVVFLGPNDRGLRRQKIPEIRLARMVGRIPQPRQPHPGRRRTTPCASHLDGHPLYETGKT